MNFEQREAVARDTLRPFYARYTPPRGFDQATQREELASIVRAVVRNMPTGMDEQGFRERLSRSLDRVADRMTTRAWPSQGEVVKAVREAGDGGSGEADDDFIYDLVKRWWNQFGDAMPSTARQHHAERLVNEGIADWVALKRGGFSIPGDVMRDLCGPKSEAKELVTAASEARRDVPEY